MKTKIDDVLVPSNMKPWTDVCHQLNGLLRGWSAYFLLWNTQPGVPGH